VVVLIVDKYRMTILERKGQPPMAIALSRSMPWIPSPASIEITRVSSWP
jgi:hypothetical protein